MATIGTKRQIRRIKKKHVLTVTLRMMSNSLRSSLVINAHLPIDKQAEVTVLIVKKFEKWRQSSSK
jgi:hypothetical protein